MGVEHSYQPAMFSGTFNCNGELGIEDIHFDENALQDVTLSPWVIVENGKLRKFTFSGVLTGTPDVDVGIYKNAVLQTTINLLTADLQSVHAVDIEVAEGDEVYLIATRNSAEGDDFIDSLMTLYTRNG